MIEIITKVRLRYDEHEDEVSVGEDSNEGKEFLQEGGGEEGEEGEEDEEPAGLVDTTRSSAGARKLVRTAA